MLVEDLIQRVQSLYSKGVQSDNTRLSPRHIYNKLLTVRSKLLYQKANKKQMFNQWEYQVLPCIELIEVEKHECPCLPPIGCKILRSKYPLPKPINSMDKHFIQSVTSIDGSVIYSETSYIAKQHEKGNKYTAYHPDYYIRNNYLYVTWKKGPKILSISGIFEDPVEAQKFPSYCGDECTDCDECKSNLELEFPIEDNMLDTLIEMCINELVVLFSQSKEDIKQDDKDN